MPDIIAPWDVGEPENRLDEKRCADYGHRGFSTAVNIQNANEVVAMAQTIPVLMDGLDLSVGAVCTRCLVVGSIEMGVVSLTRYVDDVPAVDIFYQPFLFDTEEKVRSAVAKDSPVRAPLDNNTTPGRQACLMNIRR